MAIQRKTESTSKDKGNVFWNSSTNCLYWGKTKTNIKGVLVSKVDPQSEAQEAGIINGDIIIQIENYEIKTLDDFKKATADNNKKRIYIYRKNVIFATVL